MPGHSTVQSVLGSAVLCVLMVAPDALWSQNKGLAGEALLGQYKYEDFEKPKACRQCHVDIYEQWSQAMMSQAYTHHWDEIEYFELAVPHAEKDE